MQIQNSFPIETFILDVEKGLFKEGSILKGEIINVEEEFVLLNLENHGVIKANTEIDMTTFKGKTLKFLVKNAEENQIKLMLIPIDENDYIEGNGISDKNTEENIINNILNKHEIVKDDISRKYVKTLFKFNLPLTKDNINEGLKTFDRFEQILHKTVDEKIIFLGDFSNETELKGEDLKKFLVVSQDEYVNSADLTFTFEELFSLLPKDEEKINDQFMKIIIYFIKNDVKPSLNNIKNFYELIENPKMFSEDFLKSLDVFIETSEKEDVKDVLDDLGRFKITFSKNDLEEIRNCYKIIKKEALKVIKSINSKLIEGKDSLSNKKVAKYINNLSEKVDFLNEINKNLVLFCLPFRIRNEEHTGILSVLEKNEKNKRTFKNFSVFIELDMKNLGNVKIYCEVINKTIDIKFDIEEKYILLFNAKEEELKRLVSSKGFEINNISYIVDNKLNLIDTLIVNNNPFYYLDVRV